MNNYSTTRMKKLLIILSYVELKPEYKDKAGGQHWTRTCTFNRIIFFQIFTAFLDDIVLAEHKNYFFILFSRSELVTCINLFTPYWSETFRRTKVWIQMVPKGSHSSKLTHSNVTLRGSDVHDVSTKDTRLDKRLPDPSLELITYPPGGA